MAESTPPAQRLALGSTRRQIVKLIVYWFGVPILMLVVGIIAACIPGRRAARVDPYKALKEL